MSEEERNESMATNTIDAELEQGMTERPTRRRSRWSQPRFRYSILGAAAVLLLIIAGLWLHYHGRVSTDDAQVDGDITQMAPRISGTVSQVFIVEFQQVHAGQVLVRIDPRDYQARVDQAKATLALAQAQAQAANASVPLTQGTTRSAISAARAEISAAQAQASRAQLAYQTASTAGLSYARAQVSRREAENTKAQADLARMKPLLAKAEISQQQYDAYLADAQTAASQLQATQEQLVQAQRQVEMDHAAVLAAQAQVGLANAHLTEAQANSGQVPVRTADAHSADANVEKAQANLEEAELELSYCTILAPTDGVVTGKSVERGQIVQPGQALFALVPLRNVWVRANFKETQLANVHPGDRAEVRIDMYGKTFPGQVESISGATGSRMSLLPPENATGNFVKVVQRIPIKIVLDPIKPEDAILRPGMNVEATVYTK